MSNEAKQSIWNLTETLSNGHVPAIYGEYAPMAQEIKEAFERGGAEAVQRALDTWLRVHPEIADAVPGKTKKQQKLFHFSELIDMDFERRDLVEGYIPSGKLVQVFGAPGSGKTFLLTDIALSVAQFGTVIYVAAEDFEDVPLRVHAWKAHHHLDHGNIYIWRDPIQLFDWESVYEFQTSIAPLAPKLIIIDPLANCAVGHDIDRTQDMTQAVDVLNKLRIQSGSTVLVCHHTGWNDTHERGSSVLRGACRVVYKISNDGDGLISMTCEKINGGVKPEPRYFRLIEAEESAAIVPTNRLHQSEGLTSKQEDVLVAMSLSEFAAGVSYTRLLEHTGVPKSTMSTTLSKLIDLSYIKKTGSGKSTDLNILTDKGREYVKKRFQEGQGQKMIPATLPANASSTAYLNWQVNPELFAEPPELAGTRSKNAEEEFRRVPAEFREKPVLQAKVPASSG